jgi:hypothetical protein
MNSHPWCRAPPPRRGETTVLRTVQMQVRYRSGRRDTSHPLRTDREPGVPQLGNTASSFDHRIVVSTAATRDPAAVPIPGLRYRAEALESIRAEQNRPRVASQAEKEAVVSVVPVHYLAEVRNELGEVVKKLDQLRDRDTQRVLGSGPWGRRSTPSAQRRRNLDVSTSG